jgi:hypothetical protein
VFLDWNWLMQSPPMRHARGSRHGSSFRPI